jgi:2-amino-4-hydroxy-6-hydroxymethyldihydropteridine diphosphokinase
VTVAEPRRAVLSIGSNLGDRRAHLQSAVDGLAAAGCEVVAVSDVHRTEPVGGPAQGEFLNAVVVVRTRLAPYELLALCGEIEQAARRTREVRWGPRTLDVDIIAMDGIELGDERLTIPHPRAAERAFVLVPWAQVAPGDRLRAGGPTVAEAVAALPAAGVFADPALALRVGE